LQNIIVLLNENGLHNLNQSHAQFYLHPPFLSS